MKNKEIGIKVLYQNQVKTYKNNVDIIHDIHENYDIIMSNFHKYNMELVSYHLNEAKNSLKWCILYFKRKSLRKLGLMNDIFEYQNTKFILSTKKVLGFCLFVMEDLDKIVLLEKKVDKQIEFYRNNRKIEELNKWSLVEQKSNLQLIKTSYISILRSVSVLYDNLDYINIFKKLSNRYFKDREFYNDAVCDIDKILNKVKRFK